MADIQLQKEKMIIIIMETKTVLLTETKTHIWLLAENLNKSRMDPERAGPWLWLVKENMIRYVKENIMSNIFWKRDQKLVYTLIPWVSNFESWRRRYKACEGIQKRSKAKEEKLEEYRNKSPQT